MKITVKASSCEVAVMAVSVAIAASCWRNAGLAVEQAVTTSPNGTDTRAPVATNRRMRPVAIIA